MPVIVAAIDLFKGSVLVFSRALSLAASPVMARGNGDAGGDGDEGPAGAGVVHVVHVAEPNLANVEPTAVDAPDLTGYDPSSVRKFCERHLAEFVLHDAGAAAPRLEIHNVSGDPSEEIVALAAKVDADVIVLATHGRTGIKRLLLGSVAEKVVRHAGCPVFVVRGKQHTHDAR